MSSERAEFAIAVHGGAGTIRRESLTPALAERYHEGLVRAVRAGQRVLEEGGAALDAVATAVVELEECPLFNAGHGACFTRDGRHELDASIMDGATLASGAVACLTHTRNPVLAARMVMERSEHVFMVGTGADAFAAEQGLAQVDNAWFATDWRRQQLEQVRKVGGVALDHDVVPALAEGAHTFGTVGAVARDRRGDLAAATSTGGMTNKRPGRVGDSPVIGAGCYADNRTLAASATGVGEIFIRTVALHAIAARMAHLGESLAAATRFVVMETLPPLGGRGGIVAVDRDGNLALPFNSDGMYRGYARGRETPVTAIHA